MKTPSRSNKFPLLSETLQGFNPYHKLKEISLEVYDPYSHQAKLPVYCEEHTYWAQVRTQSLLTLSFSSALFR